MKWDWTMPISGKGGVNALTTRIRGCGALCMHIGSVRLTKHVGWAVNTIRMLTLNSL